MGYGRSCHISPNDSYQRRGGFRPYQLLPQPNLRDLQSELEERDIGLRVRSLPAECHGWSCWRVFGQQYELLEVATALAVSLTDKAWWLNSELGGTQKALDHPVEVMSFWMGILGRWRVPN